MLTNSQDGELHGERRGKPVCLERSLGVPGAISFLVGTIIGSGIFATPKWVLLYVGSVEMSLVVWALCGMIALFRPRLYGEKLSRVEGSPAYPSYPGRANLSYISLQNLANRLHEKQKVGSARRVTRLAGSPFCDGRVTLLAGPTFLHINTLARSAGTTPRKLKSVFYLENEHCGLNCYQRS